MRLAIVSAVVLWALDAAAQSCPAQSIPCPGTASIACSSFCDGQVTVTRTATCNSSRTITSCVVSASSGQSCSCLSGSCTLDIGACPCRTMCGSQCLDGQGDLTCCDGKVFQGDVTCCSGGFACPSSLDCCQNGVQKCIEKGGSCCADGVHGCPRGSDCVSNQCCPRLTAESSPFTAYDGTTGYCCGEMSCASTGQCQGGAGICACARPCSGSCCPDGTACCPHKGWCAPNATGCPSCPASHPVTCGDGTCAPSGATCCGGGFFCPDGISCTDCGGGRKCCGGGPGTPMQPAGAGMAPPVPDGGGAVRSTPAAMSTGAAATNVTGGMGSGATGCGGSMPQAGAPRLGTGFECGCTGTGGVLELLALGALLRALRGRSRGRAGSPARSRASCRS